jgi:hypothetical protein
MFASYLMGAQLYHSFMFHFIRWWPLIQRFLPGA